MSRGEDEAIRKFDVCMVCVLLGVLVMAIHCFVMGQVHKLKLEAVRNGAATMTVDPETGDTVFEWRKRAENETP